MIYLFNIDNNYFIYRLLVDSGDRELLFGNMEPNVKGLKSEIYQNEKLIKVGEKVSLGLMQLVKEALTSDKATEMLKHFW